MDTQIPTENIPLIKEKIQGSNQQSKQESKNNSIWQPILLSIPLLVFSFANCWLNFDRINVLTFDDWKSYFYVPYFLTLTYIVSFALALHNIVLQTYYKKILRQNCLIFLIYLFHIMTLLYNNLYYEKNRIIPSLLGNMCTIVGFCLLIQAVTVKLSQIYDEHIIAINEIKFGNKVNQVESV